MLAAKTVKRWYQAHTWSSLICTAFLLMLCITGLPLVFSDEIFDLTDHHVEPAALPPTAPLAKLDDVLATNRRHYPQQQVQSLNWDDDEPRIFVSSLRPGLKSDRSTTLVFDAHTGRVLEAITPDTPQTPVERVMNVVTTLHIDLFAGLPGELVLGAMGTLFVVAIISGVAVYGPFMRRSDFGTVRTGNGRRTRWFDLHNLLGIVTLTWTICVGTTGVMNTLAVPLFGAWSAQTLPAMLAPYTGKPPPAAFSSVDAAVATARRALPGLTLTSITFPTDPDPDDLKSPRHYIIWGHGDTTLTKELFTPILIDAQTGKLASTEGFPWYLRALEVSRPLHFGDYGGMPLKIIWSLLDLMTITVLCSGVYLWLSRRKAPLEAELSAR